MAKQKFFSIDGKHYDVGVSELTRSAAILDGEKAGRVKSGNMIRDIIGTYYNYTITIATNRLSATDYDELYEKLTAPVESHTMVFPYGQSTISFKAYIANVEDSLSNIGVGSTTEWGGLKVQFTAMKPQRTP